MKGTRSKNRKVEDRGKTGIQCAIISIYHSRIGFKVRFAAYLRTTGKGIHQKKTKEYE